MKTMCNCRTSICHTNGTSLSPLGNESQRTSSVCSARWRTSSRGACLLCARELFEPMYGKRRQIHPATRSPGCAPVLVRALPPVDAVGHRAVARVDCAVNGGDERLAPLSEIGSKPGMSRSTIDWRNLIQSAPVPHSTMRRMPQYEYSMYSQNADVWYTNLFSVVAGTQQLRSSWARTAEPVDLTTAAITRLRLLHRARRAAHTRCDRTCSAPRLT
jgi:hypothetical protein